MSGARRGPSPTVDVSYNTHIRSTKFKQVAFITMCNYMRVTSGPRSQIPICLLLYEYLSSVSTISEATKHRGSLSALSAASSAPETEYLVAEVGPSPTSVARAYHSRISAKKLPECMQMQNLACSAG